jgi:hypothetical protein
VVRLDNIGLETKTLERERERVGVGSIVEKKVKTWLRWFGHVERSYTFCSKKSRYDEG